LGGAGGGGEGVDIGKKLRSREAEGRKGEIKEGRGSAAQLHGHVHGHVRGHVHGHVHGHLHGRVFLPPRPSALTDALARTGVERVDQSENEPRHSGLLPCKLPAYPRGCVMCLPQSCPVGVRACVRTVCTQRARLRSAAPRLPCSKQGLRCRCPLPQGPRECQNP